MEFEDAFTCLRPYVGKEKKKKKNTLALSKPKGGTGGGEGSVRTERGKWQEVKYIGGGRIVKDFAYKERNARPCQCR